MLCDGRMVCGCADPYGHRVLGDARTASLHEVWTGSTGHHAAVGSERRRLEVLRRLPAEAAAQERRRAGLRPVDAGPLPSRLYIECTAACNISCTEACCAPETGITRTRQAGMLDFDLFRRVVDEAGPVARADRLLQLRRGVPAQARGRDVRVHQDELSAHLPLHEHQRAGALGGAGAPAGALGHRRGDVLDRRRDAGELREIPAARAVRRRDREPARDGRREARARAATCRS